MNIFFNYVERSAFTDSLNDDIYPINCDEGCATRSYPMLSTLRKTGTHWALKWLVCTFSLTLWMTGHVYADIIPVEEAEPEEFTTREAEVLPGVKLKFKVTAPSDQNPWPGLMIGANANSSRSLFYQSWPHRSSSFELLIQDKKMLARIICGLAYFSGDLQADIPLEKCVNGIQGFHYSTDTVRDWAQAVRQGKFEYRNRHEEELLIEWLVAGGVLIETEAGFKASADLRHLIGASPGKRRALVLNLNHERLHVLWDEDHNFKDNHVDLWRNNPALKDIFIAEHRSYARLPEIRQIEEWAVRKNESKPTW